MNELSGHTHDQDREGYQIGGDNHEKADPYTPGIPYSTRVFKLPNDSPKGSADDSHAHIRITDTGKACVEKAERTSSVHQIRALCQKNAPKTDKCMKVKGSDESRDCYQQDCNGLHVRSNS